MSNGVREVLRVAVIAVCATGILLPFHARESWPWLGMGAGLAAAAGLTGLFVTFLTSRRRSAAAMVGGTFARLSVALASLCACFFLLPRTLTPIATALLIAYLTMLASDLVRACRQAPATSPAEVRKC